MKRKIVGISLLCLGILFLLPSCSQHSHVKGKGDGISPTTGWAYNDKRYGGFEVSNYDGQPTPPGMVFIQGGRFTMGFSDDEMPTMESSNSQRRTVTVSSFYMDETELRNVDYREYLYWLNRSYGNDYRDIITNATPDTTVWRKGLAYNELYVKMYLRHSAYNNYPVVGVNWYQATEYCKWRSERINEQILIYNRILKPSTSQSNEDVYNTESYMSAQYEGAAGNHHVRDLDPNGSGTRPVSLSDGIFLPDVRLPTEAEWEYAALGGIGNNPAPENKRRRGEEVFTDRNTLPWGNKNTTRYGLHNQYQGEFEGNYMRGGGDMMGVAGSLNDNADVTSPVRSFLPNAYGLYNMAGNVNEWVMDTYRPTSHEDVETFRPFRGNVITREKFQEDGTFEEKDSIGNIPTQMMTAAEIQSTNRYEVRTADQNNLRDGDSMSNYVYNFGNTTLINDSSKVYKGGSWADRGYWLSPGTRRFMQGGNASATVGFRCVMDRLGSPDGNNEPSGNYFGTQKKHKR